MYENEMQRKERSLSLLLRELGYNHIVFSSVARRSKSAAGKKIFILGGQDVDDVLAHQVAQNGELVLRQLVTRGSVEVYAGGKSEQFPDGLQKRSPDPA